MAANGTNIAPAIKPSIKIIGWIRILKKTLSQKLSLCSFSMNSLAFMQKKNPTPIIIAGPPSKMTAEKIRNRVK